LGPAVNSSTLASDLGDTTCSDMTLQVGITGTPAVMLTQERAPRSGVIFVVAKSKDAAGYSYSLYSINLASGARLGSAVIGGSVQGQGYGSAGSGVHAAVTFNAEYELNRPALLLEGHTLYVAFGGHCDLGPYHGWLFAYDVANPAAPRRIGIFCTTPNGKGPWFNNIQVEGGGGIWMSGEGPSSDAAGNIYLATGNGTYDGKTEFADSVLKLAPADGKLRILDWFTPPNHIDLKNYDRDLGSTGVLVLPNSRLLVLGGKEGRLYLLDGDHLRKGPLESLPVTRDPPNPPLAYNIHGTPALWPRANDMYLYVMGEESPVRQFHLLPGKSAGAAKWRFDPAGPKSSPESAPYPNFPRGFFTANRKETIWMPGAFLALSANGGTPGSGVLWAAMPVTGNANGAVVRGVLRAFNAADVSKGEIWDSESTGREADRLGQFAKFCPPVIANGKVYVATFQQETILASGRHVPAPNGDRPALVIFGPRRR